MIGFVVSVAIAAGITALAFWPLRRPRALRFPALWVGSLAGELPPVLMLLLTVSTVDGLGGRDRSSPATSAVLSLAAVTMAGLVVLVRRAVMAGPALDRALRDAGLVPRPHSAWALVRAALTPLPLRPRAVERVADLSYGDAGRRNLLDVYRPRSRSDSGPMLVYFHGGGFESGGKHRESRLLLHTLAAQGWVCISATYRLTPAAGFPDHHVDAKKAIAWARAHAAEHGGDPSTLVVAGSSAGAHLATFCAVTPNDARFQPGFEDADTSVTAAVGVYGYYGPLDAAHDPPSTPLAYLTPDAPPLLLVHGDQDTVVDVEHAREAADTFRASSEQPVVYAELPGAQHSFDVFRSIRYAQVVDAVETFLAETLRRRQRR